MELIISFAMEAATIELVDGVRPGRERDRERGEGREKMMCWTMRMLTNKNQNKMPEKVLFDQRKII